MTLGMTEHQDMVFILQNHQNIKIVKKYHMRCEIQVNVIFRVRSLHPV